jgi:hypothetical protein
MAERLRGPAGHNFCQKIVLRILQPSRTRDAKVAKTKTVKQGIVFILATLL